LNTYRLSLAPLALLAVIAVAAAAALSTPGIVPRARASQAVGAKIAGDVLRIQGTHRDDRITLRLNARDTNVIEIDVGDDGSADFSFDRSRFARISVKSQHGDDLIRVDEANGAIVEPTSISGGNGDDTLLGGSAIETLAGGPGDDFIDGNRANDIALMGPGKDTFRWDPGDASDVIEGGDGPDTLLFNGADAAENVALSASGERLTFFRNPGNITMDMNGVEVAVFNALGGGDTVTVNELASTDALNVQVNLASAQGGGDGQPDRVTVNGTTGDDEIGVSGTAGNASVTGLSATVDVTNAEVGNDRLDVITGLGDDTVDANALAGGVIQLFVDGLQVN
jgi:hypothetical protein